MSNGNEEHKIELSERKHSLLWQNYKYWDELMQMRKKHLLRVDAIKRGASTYDLEFELQLIGEIDNLLKKAKKDLAALVKGEPIAKWMISIPGIADHTAAKLICLIDDVGKFSTVSKLWRYAGYGVVDGKAEKPIAGEKRHYVARLKSEVYLVVGNFIKQQTPVYSDYYYESKADYRRKYPEPVPCEDGPQKEKYTDMHIHLMAIRKVAKVFLQHLWILWREMEGLEISMPYPHDVLGHTHYIEPPRFDLEE